MTGNAFLTDQCTKLIFALLLSLSGLKPLVSSQRCLIRWWHHSRDGTTETVDDLCVFFPHCNLQLLHLFLLLFIPPQPAEQRQVASVSLL